MDPLNLILLIIVALVGWRLRSVLGTRNDDEKPGSRADAYRLNRDAFANKPADKADDAPEGAAPDMDTNIANEQAAEKPQDIGQEAPQEEAPDEEASNEGGRGLAFLRQVEPQFDEAGFLDGAAQAYEMILTAFAEGDLSGVEGFLGADVTDGFAAAIVARRDNNQKMTTQILRLDRPALEDASVTQTSMQLDVRFRAEIITAQFDADKQLSEDELPAPTTSIDVWRFEGQRGAAPNWTLIATQAE